MGLHIFHYTRSDRFISHSIRSPSRVSQGAMIWITLVIVRGYARELGVTTMLLIGLWHGISWSFALWGLWHGMGLFVHNRWAGLVRSRWPTLTLSPTMSRLSSALGVLITFNFVSLGWLFFGLSTPELAWRAFRLLLGAT